MGKKHQRMDKRAAFIMRMARAMASGNECVLERPVLPVHPNYVMFDLEGLPPHLDELEKIYLCVWGGTGAWSAAQQVLSGRGRLWR
jgi:hypothetical protein